MSLPKILNSQIFQSIYLHYLGLDIFTDQFYQYFVGLEKIRLFRRKVVIKLLPIPKNW